MNGYRYYGRDQCKTVREAEQSAAKNALRKLTLREPRLNLRRPRTPVPIQQPSWRVSRVQHHTPKYETAEYHSYEYQASGYHAPKYEASEHEEPEYEQSEHEESEYLPREYRYIERIIGNIVGRMGGRIQKIQPMRESSLYKIKIGGSDRYCENIRKHHTRSQIYFIVDPINKTYYQKCSHPKCEGFRSARKTLIE